MVTFARRCCKLHRPSIYPLIAHVFIAVCYVPGPGIQWLSRQVPALTGNISWNAGAKEQFCLLCVYSGTCYTRVNSCTVSLCRGGDREPRCAGICGRPWLGGPRLTFLPPLPDPLQSAGWPEVGAGGPILELDPRSLLLTSLGCLSPSAGSDPLTVPFQELGCLPFPISKAPVEWPRGELIKWQTIMKLNQEQKCAG